MMTEDESNIGPRRMSSVEWEADVNMARLDALVTQKDKQAVDAGFQYGRPESNKSYQGTTGHEFECFCLASNLEGAIKVPRADELRIIEEDNDAISSAMRQSFFAREDDSESYYDHRFELFSEWMADLHDQVIATLKQRSTFEGLEAQGLHLDNLVKFVPCVGTQMDVHRGVDFMIVFHDPEKYGEARNTGFTSPDASHQPKTMGSREAVYWDPEADTIVNIDLAAHLATKLHFAGENEEEVTSDIIATKQQVLTHYYLDNKLERNGIEQDYQRNENPIRQYEGRHKELANRIVDVLEMKSGQLGIEKMRHLHNPEKEKVAHVKWVEDLTRKETKRLLASRAIAQEKAKARDKKSEAQSKATKKDKNKRKSTQGADLGLEGVELQRYLAKKKTAAKNKKADKNQKG